MGMKLAKVNGKRKNVALGARKNALQAKKDMDKEFPCPCIKYGFMGVFGDDFTAVDFCEELCQPTPHEKANQRGMTQAVRRETAKAPRVREKRSRPKAVQRGGSAPARALR